MLCKRCKHDDYSHLMGEGQCQVELIKSESEFYEVNLSGFKAYTQDIEYADKQCNCEQFTPLTIMKSVKQIPKYNKPSYLLKMGLDYYL
jgi:hypothetical protein